MCSTSLSGDAVCLPGKKDGSEGSGSDSAGGGNYRRDGRKFGDMEQNASVHPSGSVQSEHENCIIEHASITGMRYFIFLLIYAIIKVILFV